MQEMKERPILFSPPMVRAILEGRKTQTRRVVKPGRENNACPLGDIGDHLWVREKHCRTDKIGCVQYFATDRLGVPMIEPGWRPSIHMPRWAARITLEITGLRIERLTSITNEDAIAEGVSKDQAAMCDGYDAFDGSKAAFAAIWESIYGLGSYIANPLVWVVSFQKI